MTAANPATAKQIAFLNKIADTWSEEHSALAIVKRVAGADGWAEYLSKLTVRDASAIISSEIAAKERAEKAVRVANDPMSWPIAKLIEQSHFADADAAERVADWGDADIIKSGADWAFKLHQALNARRAEVDAYYERLILEDEANLAMR